MEKKTKIVNFIKGMMIIAIAVIVVWGLTKILMLKSEDGINQFDAFYKQPAGTVDVIFSGSSKVYCDIATGVLWENHGIAAFDLGGAEAPSWVSYYQLKEALKYQRPKVVCYEVSVAAMYDILYQKDSWATDNNYVMKWNSNRIEQLRVNSEDDDSFYARLIPLNVMHGRYKDLVENDFVNERDSVNYKGFDPREKVDDTVGLEDVDSITDMEPIPEKEEEYITEIIKLLRSEDIPVLLFASPYDVTEGEQRQLNYIDAMCEAGGVEFIDFNRRYDEFGMDFETDMADGGHLNYYGNYKFTDYFGKILKEEYGVPDRRGDDRYNSWDVDASIQNYERCDLAIQTAENAADAMSLAGNGYIVFGVTDGKAVIMENGATVAEGGAGFRLPYTSGKDAFLFVEEGEGDYHHYVSLFVNDEQYEEDYGNILFIYDTVTRELVRTVYY